MKRLVWILSVLAFCFVVSPQLYAGIVHSVKGSHAIILLKRDNFSANDEVEFLDSAGDQVAVGKVLKVGKRKAKIKVTLGRTKKGDRVLKLFTAEVKEPVAKKSVRGPTPDRQMGGGAGFGQILGSDFESPPLVYDLELLLVFYGRWISRMELLHWFGTEKNLETRWISIALGAGWQYPLGNHLKLEAGLWLGFVSLEQNRVTETEIVEEKLEDGFAAPYLAAVYAFNQTLQAAIEYKYPKILGGTETKESIVSLNFRMLFK